MCADAGVCGRGSCTVRVAKAGSQRRDARSVIDSVGWKSGWVRFFALHFFHSHVRCGRRAAGRRRAPCVCANRALGPQRRPARDRHHSQRGKPSNRTGSGLDIGPVRSRDDGRRLPTLAHWLLARDPVPVCCRPFLFSSCSVMNSPGKTVKDEPPPALSPCARMCAAACARGTVAGHANPAVNPRAPPPPLQAPRRPRSSTDPSSTDAARRIARRRGRTGTSSRSRRRWRPAAPIGRRR